MLTDAWPRFGSSIDFTRANWGVESRVPRQRVLAHRRSRAVRAAAPRPTHRERARSNARAGRGIPEPDPARIRAQRILVKSPSKADRRETHLRLSAKGERSSTRSRRGSKSRSRRCFVRCGNEQRHIVESMQKIERLLERPRATEPSYTLREPRPETWAGSFTDMERLPPGIRWDEQFEVLVAEIAADFAKHHDPRRERCWVAEYRGDVARSSASRSRRRRRSCDCCTSNRQRAIWGSAHVSSTSAFASLVRQVSQDDALTQSLLSAARRCMSAPDSRSCTRNRITASAPISWLRPGNGSVVWKRLARHDMWIRRSTSGYVLSRPTGCHIPNATPLKLMMHR